MGDKKENSLPTLKRDPLPIDEELWLMIEDRAQEILCTIQPNVLSEVNRKKTIDHLKSLIGGYYQSEVFPFGSVPLKTYLPDGDVDLTVLSPEDVEEELAQTVCNILGNDESPEYVVKDIQYIRAQVKVVKCTVKNLAVDISFNQMAGLYALRFLEQVDELVGKNHLFKRSIILIKSWCYYESRILGAHHGLLSTYALEILVLHIINHFHSSLLGPLEVLYRFLTYYSTFDWDKYYLTVDGPQALSSLPEIVEKPECDRAGLLLSKELLKNYRDMCSVPKASETGTREFPTKFMNILDPLRYDNNLGRSVSKGNLHRIRFALSFGARKFKDLLKFPAESMGARLEKYFTSTLDRNGRGQRPDIDVPIPAFGTGKSEKSVLIGDCDSYYGALQYVESYHDYAEPVPAYYSSPLLPYPADYAEPLPAYSSSQLLPYQAEPLPAYSNPSMFPYQADFAEPFPAYSIPPQLPSQADYAEPLPAYSIPPLLPSQADYAESLPAYSIPPQLPSQADAIALQNWCLLYQRGVNFFIPGATLYNPNAALQKTYGTEEIGRSRGTGTYIPVMTQNSYRDMRTKVTRPRRFAPLNHQALLRSHQRRQPEEEGKEDGDEEGEVVHSERDMNGTSKSFEFSNEDFPTLPGIRDTESSAPKESQQDQSSPLQRKQPLEVYSRLFGLSKEDIPTLPNIQKTKSSTSQQGVHFVTNMKDNSGSFKLTGQDFPTLPSTWKAKSSTSQESEQGHHSPWSQMNIEFGTYSVQQSPTKLSWGAKVQKEDSQGSSSQDTKAVIPKVAKQKKVRFAQCDEVLN